MLYTCARTSPIEPTLLAHLESPLVQGARFSHESGCYTYREPGIARPVHVGGLIAHLKRHHYPHHKARSTKRRRLTQVKGSSAKQGKEIDAQLGASFVRAPRHPMAKAILDHLRDRGQVLHACQVPCWIGAFRAMTQADCIAVDDHGQLHLYEVKSGYPIGGYRTQGTLRNVPGEPVPNTKMNHWQLQVRYTELGLYAGGVTQFASVQVIQVYEHYDKRARTRSIRIKVHPQPAWARAIQG